MRISFSFTFRIAVSLLLAAASYGRNYSDVLTPEESAHTCVHRGFPNAFKTKLPAVLDTDDLSRTPVRLDISAAAKGPRM